MYDQIMGVIQLFTGNYVPKEFMLCDGRLLDVSNHTALFSVLGNTYGGDGVNTFALPDLRSRLPIGPDEKTQAGRKGGLEKVSLTAEQIPSHNHSFKVSGGQAETPISNDGTKASLLFALGRTSEEAYAYASTTPETKLSDQAIDVAGTGDGHNNMQPYLALNYIICVKGLLPSDVHGSGYVGQVLLYAGKRLPKGYLLCDGLGLKTNENSALFSLIGTKYGGSGNPIFNLPDYRGRTAVGVGKGAHTNDIHLAEKGGELEHALVTNEVAVHEHVAQVSNENATAESGAGDRIMATVVDARSGVDIPANAYDKSLPGITLNEATIGVTGEGKAHDNVQPFLGVSYIICFEGTYPSFS